MPPLRILHVTPYWEAAWAFGGIPRLVPPMARALARRGHEVTVATTDAADARRRAPAPASPRRAGEPRVVVFPNLSNRLAFHLQLFLPRGMRRFLEREARGFDVAHLHACRNLPVEWAARALAEAGVPWVASPNGTAPRIERRLLAKRGWDLAFGPGVLSGAERLLAVSAAEEATLSRLAPGVAVSLIPNPVDDAEWLRPPDPGRFRTRFASDGRRLVVFLGKLSPRKRVDLLLDAMATLPADVRLVVAGPDFGAGPALRRQARRLRLDPERVTFVPTVTGGERLDLLAAADLVAYPGEHEVFGLVAAEAILAGTPAIAASDSGCGELVAACGGGRAVPPGNGAALAATIREMLQDRDGWKRRARDAAPALRAELSADAVAGRLEAIYREVLAERSRSTAASD